MVVVARVVVVVTRVVVVVDGRVVVEPNVVGARVVGASVVGATVVGGGVEVSGSQAVPSSARAPVRLTAASTTGRLVRISSSLPSVVPSTYATTDLKGISRSVKTDGCARPVALDGMNHIYEPGTRSRYRSMCGRTRATLSSTMSRASTHARSWRPGTTTLAATSPSGNVKGPSLRTA